MDLLLEGILIAIMMAIILFFIVYEYSAFFAPKSSISYYNSFVGMADSACTSIQTASNVQFSSPTIFVFQKACEVIIAVCLKVPMQTKYCPESIDGFEGEISIASLDS